MGEHLWAAHTPVVGQVNPRVDRGADGVLSAGDGLQDAIQYMKQEVDDAQRIAQMMAVRSRLAVNGEVTAMHCCLQMQMQRAWLCQWKGGVP